MLGLTVPLPGAQLARPQEALESPGWIRVTPLGKTAAIVLPFCPRGLRRMLSCVGAARVGSLSPARVWRAHGDARASARSTPPARAPLGKRLSRLSSPRGPRVLPHGARPARRLFGLLPLPARARWRPDRMRVRSVIDVRPDHFRMPPFKRKEDADKVDVRRATGAAHRERRLQHAAFDEAADERWRRQTCSSILRRLRGRRPRLVTGPSSSLPRRAWLRVTSIQLAMATPRKR